MRIKEIEINNCMRITEITNFYHATCTSLIDSILQTGLGNTETTNWEDSIPGIVYLAKDPDVAISYAETVDSDEDSDELLDISLITIPANLLDPTKIYKDRNVIGDGGTFEYHGIIPITRNMIT